jgi:hypothetical protein
VFGNLRSALLFGDSEQRADTSEVDGGVFAPRDSFRWESSELLPVMETEIGVEYAAWLTWARLFVRAALAGQAYFGAGNATFHAMFATETETEDEDLDALDNTGNLGLIGLKLSAGIDY